MILTMTMVGCSEWNSKDWWGWDWNCFSYELLSLLDILKAPTTSDLSRKQSIARNPLARNPLCGKKESQNIKPIQHVKEYKDEPFTVSTCKLFCKACREEISVSIATCKLFCKACREEISVSIENHLKSQKHHNSKQKIKQRAIREAGIAESLAKYSSDVRLKGHSKYFM